MERRSRKKAVTFTKDKIKKYTYFLAVPVVVLVLILVIIGVDRGTGGGKKEEGGTTAGTESLADGIDNGTAGAESGGAGTESSGAEMDLSQYELKQDEIPELTALVQEYCQAKMDRDPARLLAVFGKKDMSEAELEEERAKMDKVRQVVDGYENITCYFVDGLEPATYVIYPYFEIQYKDAAMLMPSLTWSYVKRDGEGTFYMTQDVTDQEAEFIAKVSMLDSVKSLSAQVEEQAENALEMDAVLRDIYQVMEMEPAGIDVPEETVDMTGETEETGETQPGTDAGSESTAGETMAETQEP